MKKDIHPPYSMATVRCACGTSFQVGSTKALLAIEICSQCHPYYTGHAKLIDTAGRVEKFQKRYTKAPAPAVKEKKPRRKNTKEAVAV